MNERNLIPQSHELTVEEQSNGGKASGASRRKKRDMKKCMELLLSMPASQMSDYQLLSDMGVSFDELDEQDVNNMLAVNAALLKQAKLGDVSAIKELRSIIRDDDMIKHKIRYDNERLKLEREKAFPPAPESGTAYNGIPANLIAPSFASVVSRRRIGQISTSGHLVKTGLLPRAIILLFPGSGSERRLSTMRSSSRGQILLRMITNIWVLRTAQAAMYSTMLWRKLSPRRISGPSALFFTALTGAGTPTRLHMCGVHILRRSIRLLFTMNSDAIRRVTMRLPRS